MHYIIGFTKQLENLIQPADHAAPAPVLEQIWQTIKILENCYGSGRDLETSLGGYAVVFTGMDENDLKIRKYLFQKYNINEQDYEYRDCIVSCDGLKWIEELFILSSDYSLIMYYPLLPEG